VSAHAWERRSLKRRIDAYFHLLGYTGREDPNTGVMERRRKGGPFYGKKRHARWRKAS
jgi:hypothetical protein